MKNIVIIGATSAIARATARVYAERGDNLYLLGRDYKRLSTMAQDLEVRGAQKTACRQMDAGLFNDHEQVIKAVFDDLKKVDLVLIAHGTLPDQKRCEQDFKFALEAFNVNALGTISLLTHLANRLETQKSGVLAVITSVAGVRGRQSNYVYGAAKGMVSIFLQGLRNRLQKATVTVLDIKPGFVDTPMTTHFKKGVLWVGPDKIAGGIVKAIERGNSVVFLPWFWLYLMVVVKNIPELIFKKMRL